MTATDWIIDIVLILIVVRQLREERLTPRFLLLPLSITAYVAQSYLTGVPTHGDNLLLLAGCVAVGALFGLVGGLLTKVRGENGEAFIRAGFGAAALWIASMTARLGFIIWITHSGRDDLVRFSIDHHITGAGVWQDALVLLALSEVVVRVGTLAWRGQRAKTESKSGAPTDSTTPRLASAA